MYLPVSFEEKTLSFNFPVPKIDPVRACASPLHPYVYSKQEFKGAKLDDAPGRCSCKLSH